ncbi:hypothetical protein JL721_2042 [Aureococcus anophagefferens]|nr:hypothetical protein JL721_2042 [Aureococcus anophagefferens]
MAEPLGLGMGTLDAMAERSPVKVVIAEPPEPEPEPEPEPFALPQKSLAESLSPSRFSACTERTSLMISERPSGAAPQGAAPREKVPWDATTLFTSGVSLINLKRRTDRLEAFSRTRGAGDGVAVDVVEAFDGFQLHRGGSFLNGMFEPLWDASNLADREPSVEPGCSGRGSGTRGVTSSTSASTTTASGATPRARATAVSGRSTRWACTAALRNTAAAKLAGHLPVVGPVDAWLADNQWFGLDVFCLVVPGEGVGGAGGKLASHRTQGRVARGDVDHSSDEPPIHVGRTEEQREALLEQKRREHRFSYHPYAMEDLSELFALDEELDAAEAAARLEAEGAAAGFMESAEAPLSNVVMTVEITAAGKKELRFSAAAGGVPDSWDGATPPADAPALDPGRAPRPGSRPNSNQMKARATRAKRPAAPGRPAPVEPRRGAVAPRPVEPRRGAVAPGRGDGPRRLRLARGDEPGPLGSPADARAPRPRAPCARRPARAAARTPPGSGGRMGQRSSTPKTVSNNVGKFAVGATIRVASGGQSRPVGATTRVGQGRPVGATTRVGPGQSRPVGATTRVGPDNRAPDKGAPPTNRAASAGPARATSRPSGAASLRLRKTMDIRGRRQQ